MKLKRKKIKAEYTGYAMYRWSYFALWPVTCDGGERVWLERVQITEQHTYFPRERCSAVLGGTYWSESYWLWTIVSTVPLVQEPTP